MANGTAAHTPRHPPGRSGVVKRLPIDTCGPVSAKYRASSKVASAVTTSSKARATVTPRALIAPNSTNAPTATASTGSAGTRKCTYDPIARAMAGGAKANSISVAAAASRATRGPKARPTNAKGPPASGIAAASSV
jgi:hypothetical protein